MSASGAANIILIIFIIIGIMSAIFPEQTWYLEKGMWYKDSEPTDWAILMTRIRGIAVAVISALAIYIMAIG